MKRILKFTRSLSKTHDFMELHAIYVSSIRSYLLSHSGYNNKKSVLSTTKHDTAPIYFILKHIITYKPCLKPKIFKTHILPIRPAHTNH